MTAESEEYSINKNLDDVKDDIRQGLKNEPDILKLFDILDKEIITCNKDALEKITYSDTRKDLQWILDL